MDMLVGILKELAQENWPNIPIQDRSGGHIDGIIHFIIGSSHIYGVIDRRDPWLEFYCSYCTDPKTAELDDDAWRLFYAPDKYLQVHMEDLADPTTVDTIIKIIENHKDCTE